jgi:hypothetical protein
MAHFNAPRPPYRWQRGLLLRGLPRRFIPGRFGDLPPGRPDQPVPNPVGQAGSRQLGGLPDQPFMLGSDTDEQVR